MKARDLEWWIVGFLGLVTLGLAFSGYHVLYSEAGTSRNILDLIYQSIKIFGMDLVDEFSSPLPWQLEAARWLAPALVIYTAIKAILFLIRREIKSAFIKYHRDHIVIVGLNYMSRYLAGSLLANGEKVVIVGDIADVRKLDPVEREGAVLVEGELSGKNFLRNLGAARARYFVFLNDDDDKNIEDALTVNNYLADHAREPNVTLYTHVSDDLKLDEVMGLRLLEDHQLQQNADKQCEIKIFSEYERASRIIFNKYSPDTFTRITSPDDQQVRIAVIGSGRLAQSFILRVARLGHFANLKKTLVTMFQNGTTVLDRMQLSFKQMKNFIDIELVDAAPELFDGENFRRMNAEHRFSAVYILCDDDTVVPGILTRLARIDLPGRINIVVAVNNPFSLLSKKLEGMNFESIVIHKFSITEETFTHEGLISETLDKLARVVHNDYRSKHEDIDPSKTSHRPWELLPTDFKNQNREQADHILIKLRALGYEGDVDISQIVVPQDKLELLSRMEHNRWWAFIALNGWVRGDKRDDQNRKHTDLKPYDELDEEVKQSDRDAVLNIPHLLLKYKQIIDSGDSDNAD